MRPCDWSDALFCGCFCATGCAARPRLGEARNAMHDVHAILLRQGCLLRAACPATQSVSPGLFTSGCISGAVPRPVPTGRPETSTYCSGRAVLPDDAHATWMGPRRSATYCSTYCVCTVLLLGRGEGACAVHWRRSAYTRPPLWAQLKCRACLVLPCGPADCQMLRRISVTVPISPPAAACIVACLCSYY